MKKYQSFFLSENFNYLEVKFSIYLNRHVFVMVTGNYNFETGSMISILEQLSLKARANIPCDDLQPPNRRSRNQRLMAFQVSCARTDIYKYSFFPAIIRDWNALPAFIISSAESYEDLVARFTSLVRSRD